MTETTDYIVVGAGSAGAVVAARLSEDPAVRVTLIEAGRRERHPLLSMPIAFPIVMNDARFNWNYEGEPEPHADMRRLRQPRGKGLGGSSLINGMLYARGHPRDYDEWRQLGLDGWSYDDVLPFFKKSENHWDAADDYHATGGPLSTTKHVPDRALFPRLIETVTKLGYKVQRDHHGAEQEGWGSPDISIHRGRRGSTAARFLYPAMRRPNLTVVTGALASRVELDNGHAVALHYRKDGAGHVLRAEREIVLSGGAYNTPQLMLLSGIGPADELRELGVEVAHDLPGVGRNLQDHPSIAMMWGADRAVTLTNDLRFDRLTLSMLEWLATGKGRIANMPVVANGFVKTLPQLERPDAQCLFQPTSIFARPWFPGVRKPEADVVAMACVQLRPEGRGWVRLASADPAVPPRILTNILSTENDRAFFRRVVPQMREILATSPLADVIRGELMPGADAQGDAEIDAWVRANARTAMHAAASCAMGTGAEAVCDAQLRVRGIDSLRIADASVMPRIVGGNTNAASIMIGEKAAAMIASAGAEVNDIAAVPDAAPRSTFEVYRSKGTTPELRMMVHMVLAGRRWRSVLDDHLRAIGQSSARLEAMAAIINSPSPSSQSDIAKRLRIEGPTMTRMLDALARDGLVERKSAPGDRRTKHLVVTPRGEEALQQMFAIVDPLRDRLVGSLSPEDVERLSRLLGGMVEHLDRGLVDEAGDGG